jgi:8-oxo-dGTP pyrophosphatase MutT (NUDIX family)
MPEFWDLYDAERRPLNELHMRGDRMRRGTYHIAVGIWTVNDKNEILLTLRSREKRDWPQMWENTAGSVLAGESSRQAAVRELREETGIRVKEDELFLLGTERGRNTIGDCYIVRKNVPLRDIVFQRGETCAARWVSLAGLDDMIARGIVAPPVSGRLARIRATFESFLYAEIGGHPTTSESEEPV